MPLPLTLKGLVCSLAVAASAPNTSPANTVNGPVTHSQDEVLDFVRRNSEELVTGEDAWSEPGFRLQVGLGYSAVVGVPSAAHLIGPDTLVLAGFRLVPWTGQGQRPWLYWGLNAAIRFQGLHDLFTGMRWAVTIEPTLHLGAHAAVGLGLGYAGLFGNKPQKTAALATTAAPDPGRIDLDQTGPMTRDPLGACEGDGMIAVLRGSYLFIVGDLFATGPMLHLDTQLTHCVDPNAASSYAGVASVAVPEAWWWHVGIGLSWVAAWR
jgi:hypothetical protein